MTKLRSVRLTRLLPAIFMLVVVSTIASRAAADVHRLEINGETMGTTYKVLIATEDESVSNIDFASQIKVSIDNRLADIDALMSTWKPDSELSKFNTAHSTNWVDVSAETAKVVRRALQIAQSTNGAFDPTVGPLVRLWNFGKRYDNEIKPPTRDELESVRAWVGYEKVEARLSPPALRKLDSRVELDLSGIAKGFAVDEVSRILSEAGYVRHLVEIGGEMRAHGQSNNGSTWTIGIEKPVELIREVHSALPLKDASIATSGDYRNYYEVDGKRYSHTIDPSTGKPITHKLASVSIIADDCMSADGWATAINVLGPDRGFALAKKHNLTAMLLVRKGESFVEFSTPKYQALDVQRIEQSPTPAESNGPSIFSTFLAALIVIGLALAGMAVGVIFSNRRIQGSCGGLANLPGHDGSSPCEFCSNPAEECKERIAASESPDSQPSVSETTESESFSV